MLLRGAEGLSSNQDWWRFSSSSLPPAPAGGGAAATASSVSAAGLVLAQFRLAVSGAVASVIVAMVLLVKR